MKSLFRGLWLLVVTAILATAAAAAELNVFAAASLSDALTEIGKAYEKASGDSVRFNFGASSLLARQIKEGAPADVFFSADEAKMDDLEKAGLIAAGTRRILLSNTLVIVVGAENGVAVRGPTDLASAPVRKLALGETQTVPAGIYAREYLQKKGLWEKLSPKVVPTENVRAALAAVENGNAEAAIVYKTDALISKKVKVAFEVAASEGPKILYPVAVVKESKNAAAAGAFVAHLATKEAWAVFAKYGFLAPATVSASAAEPFLKIVLPDRTVAFTAEEFAALPRKETKLADMQDKEERVFSGVAVRDLLAKVGLPTGDKMRGPALSLGLLVRCKDNYTVLFSLAEFDENFSSRTILLADREDGEILPPSAAPLRIVVPGDRRPARSARQVVALEVVSFRRP